MNYWIGTSPDDEPAPYIGVRETKVNILARLKWTKELPTKIGMYRFFEKYENQQTFSCWIEISDGGGYLGVANEDYVEPLHEWIDDNKVVSRRWFGPLPVPEPPDLGGAGL